MGRQQTKETDLGNDKIGGLLFKLALPAIMAQVINLLYNLVDRMYIGHIRDVGPAALTGVGVTMPVIMAISAFAALVSMGGAPRASIMMGKGDKEEAQRILGNCAAMLVLTALVLTLVVQLFGRQILLLFGASDNTIGYAWAYVQIYSLGTIFVQLALGLNAFINAQGYARIGMATVAIGAVCNIILDPVFIFGFHMGVRGAALATILSQAVSCVWILRFLTGKKPSLQLQTRYMRLRASTILPCIGLGFAPFVMQFTESILNICFNSSLLKYGGDTAVGAMTILTSVMQFSMLPLSGLSQGAQPITGYNFGARKPERVRESFAILLKCSLGYSAALWLIVMLFPRALATLFAQDSAFLDYTAWALRIFMATSVVMGIQIACQQTFIAIGNAKTSLFLAIYRKIILLIPLIYILPHFFGNKVMAVFLAEPVADVIAVTTTSILFARQFKKALQELRE